MAAVLNNTVIDGAPGNQLTIYGSGLVPGPGLTSVTLSNQGVTAQPNLAPQTITLTSSFATSGCVVTIPDGAMSGKLTITAGDGTTATCALRAVSQYVQASEYFGEGTNVSTLASGELDAILQRASAMCDAYMNGSVRLLQKLERHRYKARPNGAPFIMPFRTRGRNEMPIVSVDQLTFISAVDLVTVFNPNDWYVNPQSNYLEVLAYAVGNYALVGQLQMIGYSANVMELSYTSGYSIETLPDAIRTATILTATMMLNRRQRQSMGMGAFASFEGAIKARVDEKAVTIPPDARALLRPWVARSLG